MSNKQDFIEKNSLWKVFLQGIKYFILNIFSRSKSFPMYLGIFMIISSIELYKRFLDILLVSENSININFTFIILLLVLGSFFVSAGIGGNFFEKFNKFWKVKKNGILK